MAVRNTAFPKEQEGAAHISSLGIGHRLVATDEDGYVDQQMAVSLPETS